MNSIMALNSNHARITMRLLRGLLTAAVCVALCPTSGSAAEPTVEGKTLMTERDSEDARAGALVLAETAQTIIRIGHALKG